MVWVKIDFHSGKAVYKQIKDSIKNDIFSGKLKTDEALPSIREMAKNLNVNPNTVVRAYRELENEDYLYSRPGIGSFVHGKNSEYLEEKAKEIVHVELAKIVELAHRYQLSKANILDLIRQSLEKIYGGDNNGNNRD